MRLLCRIAVLLLAMFTAPLASASSSAPVVTWEELAPSVDPYDDPFAKMPAEQIDALRQILLADRAAKNGRLDDDLAEAAAEARLRLEAAGRDVEHLYTQREIIVQRRQEAVLGVSTALVDSTVIIDGYALPLRSDNGRVVEFLLVPWVGACIHTPAPNPNQIVHVDYPAGFEAKNQFTPVRLEGRLIHRPAKHDLFLVDGTRRIPVSYGMEQAVIGGTPGRIVAAGTATEGMSWFATVQARITGLFTTAMTDMEQGRSAGTVALALLIAFAYGALHTLGPGHGKAVVISYFIGAGGSLRRGVVMGVQVAVMHVLSAVIVVFLLDFAVRQATGAAPSDYRTIRLGSYALVAVIGAVMLWRALAPLRARRATKAAASQHHHRHDGDGHDHHHHHHHDHGGCAACTAAASSSRGGGWIAAAVGVVPCTGALIVMLFGLANDMVIPAVMMVVAISAGMALAMSAIGIAAIAGRNWAEARVATNPERRARFASGARIAAASCVLLIGATLFAGTALQGVAPKDPEGTQITLSNVPRIKDAALDHLTR